MENEHPQKRNERGQSMAELAISIAFLLILLAGVIDLGRAFFTYIALRDAAQEGASYATVARIENSDPRACAAIEERTRSTSNTPVDLTDTANVQVAIEINGVSCGSAPLATTCLGAAVEVTVTYTDFSIIMPFMGTIVGSQTIDLNASVSDTVLTPACE